jgi:hypothetical protein
MSKYHTGAIKPQNVDKQRVRLKDVQNLKAAHTTVAGEQKKGLFSRRAGSVMDFSTNM